MAEEQQQAQVEQKKQKGARKAAVVSRISEYQQEKLRRSGPSRLRALYENELRFRLREQLGLKNVMQVPRLRTITVNMGLGDATGNPKLLDAAVEELALITGQKPIVTQARKSIATFKLREGQKIGCKVTLRRDSMYEFLDRLVSFALPRVRDFKGISPRGFDGRGNYTLGIREGIIFPEASFEGLDRPRGMNITIVTTAKTDEEGRALLRLLGLPFRN